MTGGAFDRGRLPAWPAYADQIGLVLAGKGRWRNALCDFHDDREPSMRVNVESGGWICMACGTKGGDVLSHCMLRTGLSFVDAAKDLGAWSATTDSPAPHRPTPLSARDAMAVVALELMVAVIVIADVRGGLIPTDLDWVRFLKAAGRIEALAGEFAS